MDTTQTALVTRLKKLSSSVISDVLDCAGYMEQSLANAIRPLVPTMRFAGPAMCFSGIDETPGDPTPALSTYAIDERVDAGTVVLIAANGHAVSAMMGGLMALSFTKKGCAAFVTDGGVRDADEITALGLPTFSRYVCPLNNARRWRLTTAGAPVEVLGHASPTVRVAPGDLLIGDADGVMAIPQGIAAEIIGWAEQLAAIEERIVAGLSTGKPRAEVFGANPRFDHIRKLR